jgi:mono/diheme cytochrome c family protein
LKVALRPVLRSPKMRRVLPAVLLLLLVACADRPDAGATGAEIFGQICAACHAADMSGGIGPPLGPGSHAAAQTDEFLIATINLGRGSRMPSFRQTLTEEQIRAVVDYIREVQGG